MALNDGQIGIIADQNLEFHLLKEASVSASGALVDIPTAISTSDADYSMQTFQVSGPTIALQCDQDFYFLPRKATQAGGGSSYVTVPGGGVPGMKVPAGTEYRITVGASTRALDVIAAGSGHLSMFLVKPG